MSPARRLAPIVAMGEIDGIYKFDWATHEWRKV